MSAPARVEHDPLGSLVASMRLERLAAVLWLSGREDDAVTVLGLAEELVDDSPHEEVPVLTHAILAGEF